jgi:hypothetical protein
MLVDDVHYPLQRVLCLLLALDVPNEFEEFAAMLGQELTFELDVSGRHTVMDPVTSRAHFAVGFLRFGQPLPAAFVEHCTALRA